MNGTYDDADKLRLLQTQTRTAAKDSEAASLTDMPCACIDDIRRRWTQWWGLRQMGAKHESIELTIHGIHMLLTAEPRACIHLLAMSLCINTAQIEINAGFIA